MPFIVLSGIRFISVYEFDRAVAGGGELPKIIRMNDTCMLALYLMPNVAGISGQSGLPPKMLRVSGK